MAEETRRPDQTAGDLPPLPKPEDFAPPETPMFVRALRAMAVASAGASGNQQAAIGLLNSFQSQDQLKISKARQEFENALAIARSERQTVENEKNRLIDIERVEIARENLGIAKEGLGLERQRHELALSEAAARRESERFDRLMSTTGQFRLFMDDFAADARSGLDLRTLISPQLMDSILQIEGLGTMDHTGMVNALQKKMAAIEAAFPGQGEQKVVELADAIAGMAILLPKDERPDFITAMQTMHNTALSKASQGGVLSPEESVQVLRTLSPRLSGAMITGEVLQPIEFIAIGTALENLDPTTVTAELGNMIETAVAEAAVAFGVEPSELADQEAMIAQALHAALEGGDMETFDFQAVRFEGIDPKLSELSHEVIGLTRQLETLRESVINAEDDAHMNAAVRQYNEVQKELEQAQAAQIKHRRDKAQRKRQHLEQVRRAASRRIGLSGAQGLGARGAAPRGAGAGIARDVDKARKTVVGRTQRKNIEEQKRHIKFLESRGRKREAKKAREELRRMESRLEQ